jgi:glyoxylase-like metal-dependent hydrolase (beta-lactamase superfamily II)
MMRLMTRRGLLKTAFAAAAVVDYSAAGVFLSTYGPAPLPRPDAHPGELPPASPPPGMAAFQIPTGFNHRTSAFAYRGGAFSDPWDSVMTSVLVTHPRGDLLLDTGLGRQIDTQFQHESSQLRAITKYIKLSPAADQLEAAGYDLTSLSGILLTHAHWDHISGVPDFAEVPVLVTRAERDFIAVGKNMGVARTITDADYQVYDFPGGAYLGFQRSLDLYGDGSLVVVPAPGHTPGSIIAFMVLPDGRRFAFVGDLAWQRESITEREERPWLIRTNLEDNPAEVRDNLVHMSAVWQRFPEMILAPAHDARGFAELPVLGRGAA